MLIFHEMIHNYNILLYELRFQISLYLILFAVIFGNKIIADRLHHIINKMDWEWKGNSSDEMISCPPFSLAFENNYHPLECNTFNANQISNAMPAPQMNYSLHPFKAIAQRVCQYHIQQSNNLHSNMYYICWFMQFPNLKVNSVNVYLLTIKLVINMIWFSSKRIEFLFIQ